MRSTLRRLDTDNTAVGCQKCTFKYHLNRTEYPHNAVHRSIQAMTEKGKFMEEIKNTFSP